MREMTETLTYRVPDMSCGHCKAAVEGELARVPGVERAEVDLETKLVTVSGEHLVDDALRAAIEKAGYEVGQ